MKITDGVEQKQSVVAHLITYHHLSRVRFIFQLFFSYYLGKVPFFVSNIENLVIGYMGGVHPPLRNFLISDFVLQDTKNIFC